MEIKKREEKIIQNGIDLYNEIYYLDFSKKEFYEYLEDSGTIDAFVAENFRDIILQKLYKDKEICIILKKLNNRVSLYLSKKELAEKFHNNACEHKDKEYVTSLLFINDGEIKNILCHSNWLVFIGPRNTLLSQYNLYFNDFKLLKEKLVTNECTLLEYTDLGCDGKILSFTNLYKPI